MIQPLDKALRAILERTIRDARDIAEDAARAALEQIGVGEATPFTHLSEQDRELRRKLRVHGRQIGDSLNDGNLQTMDRLVEEVAYEHWHRMLFARFLAENNLLMYPDPVDPVAVTLDECEDLAADEGAKSGWELAARFAARMLPQIFRIDSPVFQLTLPPEHQQKLEKLLAGLPIEVFTASDSLGWVYQFWQAKKKDAVNESEVKIGARELPAVTQLFTEPYMVSFLLDNSLGAWWAARRLSEDDLKNATGEDELRKKVAIPGVPLEYLRFVVSEASSFGIIPNANKKTHIGNISSPHPHLDQASLHIRQGDNLPHWTCNSAIYHVTFRLADSVPAEQRESWKLEREAIVTNAEKSGRALTEDEEKRLHYLYSEKIEKYLDAGIGACHLKNEPVAKIVADALQHFDGDRYRLHAWCIMPNHVHVIVEPSNGHELDKINHSWKSFTSNEANKVLGLSGQFWQQESYDHIIRSEKEYWHQIRYVWENPEKAGLKDWQWRWSEHPASGISGTPDISELTKRPELEAEAEAQGKSRRPELEAPGTPWTPAAGTFEKWPKNLSELKTLDPCCGSGHFIVATFLMLVPMRMELEGLSAKDAVDSVLRENIHGLELDQRCVELAAFALALAAWKYPEAGGYRVLPELNIACTGLSVSVAKEEWKQLGLGKRNLTIALDLLYDTFQDAPVLGSLLNPAKSEAAKLVDEKLVKWGEFSSTLEQALKQGQSDEQKEVAVVAHGLAKSAMMLSKQYNLVITNVPYLARGKQDERLREYCENNYPAAKNDLATVFLDRCLELCVKGGSTSIVLPQNWLFLTSYTKFREKLLQNDTWNLIARLGPGAFETISGEVVKAILISLTRGNSTAISGGLFGESTDKNLIKGVDVSEPRTAAEKAAQLLSAEVKSVEQAKQLENPDATIEFNTNIKTIRVGQYAFVRGGITTGDSPRFRRLFCELNSISEEFEFEHSTSNRTKHYAGNELCIKWEKGEGELKWAAENAGATIAGRDAWKKNGIAITYTSSLSCSIYKGNFFENIICVLIPISDDQFNALWSFCESECFFDAVRSVNQKLSVDVRYFEKVPFDLDHWAQIAKQKYPNGLPKPYTDDPTQWIFHGHPCGSVVWDDTKKWTVHGILRTDSTVLHIAVARLLGYRWPAELDTKMELSDEQREWVNRCTTLLPFADEDGIVCIPSVRGESSAADRLLNLLAAAYGDAWSNDILSQLLKNADHAGKTLETWLREKFFTQHCKLFQHRPFIWHIWDGLRDGFSALVNYHKLDYKNLETLVYTYLGDWISRQKQDITDGVDGAQERLSAAEGLKKKLELILNGEAPYDIFVRWKPLEKQPIGWNPDHNDGVRLNIRPFMSVPDVSKKGAGVLRDKPNIDWKKDRGKDVESAPWYKLFDGDRINDHHLTLEEKLAIKENNR